MGLHKHGSFERLAAWGTLVRSEHVRGKEDVEWRLQNYPDTVAEPSLEGAGQVASPRSRPLVLRLRSHGVARVSTAPQKRKRESVA